MLFLKRLGIETLEMTGGEVTLREDLFALIAYAKQVARFPHISIITNGSRLCEALYAQRIVRAGVDEIIVSLHGHTADLHDRLAGRQGSFQETLRAIAAVRAAGALCRVNTVVTALNVSALTEIARLVASQGVCQFNPIIFSPLDDADTTHNSLWVRYATAATAIKAMLEDAGSLFQNISVKVLPFCCLRSHVSSITNLFQNLYDPFEWDYFARVCVRQNVIVACAAAIAGAVLFMDIRRLVSVGWRVGLREGIVHFEAARHCAKPSCCRLCRYNPICPGIWKEYARRFGVQELNPCPGEPLWEVDQPLRSRTFAITNRQQCG